MPEPTLTRYDVAHPRGLVLVLHGGQEQSIDPVQLRQGSWLRMVPIARAIAAAGRPHDVSVWLLRNRLRGWNATPTHDPDAVQDARWALATWRSEHPDRSTALVGHSMGGRTACAVADEAGVAGVTGLAPWLPQDEPIAAVAGRPLLVAHGSLDRWTSPRWSRDFVERARAAGSPAAWVGMGPVGHFMLRRVRRWNTVAIDTSLGMLGVAPYAARLSARTDAEPMR
ncbi:MAG: alpha/beta fold hydrolase [Nocardioidaceae bacterium]